MKFVFWQNILSPHQLPYILQLINDDRVTDVTIVAPQVMEKARIAMGWEHEMIERLKNRCTVVINPSDEGIQKIFETNNDNSIHLFSGIRAFPLIYKAFLKSLDYNVKRGLITERPNTFAFGLPFGKPLWLHRLKFFIQDRKYIPYIHYIFAIGENCADYYRSISSKWKIIPFAYCTESIKGDNLHYKNGGVIFIGSLSIRKNVGLLINAITLINKRR